MQLIYKFRKNPRFGKTENQFEDMAKITNFAILLKQLVNHHIQMQSKVTGIVNPILAGLSIGIAAVCFLRGGQLVGAALFAFGLSTVVLSKWPLFTGAVGFSSNVRQLSLMILLNIIGASLAATFAMTNAAATEAAHSVVDIRLANGFGMCLLYSIGCGFIMTVSVKYARQNQWIPLLLGIPTFIICGFPHCIADVVYYAADGRIIEAFPCWIASVIGNSIGGNIPTYTRFLKNAEE